MTSAAGTPTQRIADLKGRLEKLTGPATLSSLVTDTVGAAQSGAIEGQDWTKSIFDSMVDNIKIEGSADASKLTFSGDFEAYNRARGAVTVTTAESGEPYFVCSFSFQPSFINSIPQLAFLNDVNPGPFTLALASMAVKKFPLQVPSGEEEVELFQGVNFFSSISPTGAVRGALSGLLAAPVDTLFLDGGLELKTTISDKEDESVAISPTVKIKGGVKGRHAFAGIDAIQVTESAIVLSAPIKDGEATGLTTGLESLFNVATPDGVDLAFKGEIEFTASQDEKDPENTKVDVKGTLAMTEDSPAWTNALGVRGLDLGGLGLEIDIKDQKPTIGIRAGSFSLGSKINGSGAVGVAGIEAPPYLDFSKCMVSLSVDHLPIGHLWEAIGSDLGVTVPEQVGTITIDNAQIYAVPQETKIAGKTFEPGFKVAGTLKVLGWSGPIEGEIEFSTLVPAAKTFNQEAFSAPTQLSAFAYFDPLPVSGDGFLTLTQPSGPVNSRFPTFPTPDLLPPPIPTGAKMAVQIGLAKQEAQIAMGATLMGSVSEDFIALFQPTGATGYFKSGVHAGSFGAVSCAVGVQSWPSGYSIQGTSFSFTANVSSGSIAVTSPVKVTLPSVSLSADFTLDLDATLSALPSASFSASASGSFSLGPNISVSLPKFAVTSPSVSLSSLLSDAVGQAEDALGSWFRDASNVATAIRNGLISLPPVTVPELPVKIDIPVHVDPPHYDPPHVDPPHIHISSPF